MRPAWLAEALYLAALLVAAILLKLAIGGPLLAWILAAVLFGAVRHVRELHRLESWLRIGRKRNPPEGWGIWGAVFEHYYQLQRRYFRRKKRLSRLISEFRESTDAMPDGSVVLDDHWRILWFNEAAEKMLSLDSKRDRGQPLTNLVRSPNLPSFLESREFSRALDITSPVSPRRVLSVRVVPYGHSQYLLLFRDITRIRRLEAMRRDFVANASHELRSPLTVLAGYLESLREDPAAPGEWQVPLAEMDQQTRRMTTLVNDLLELSRLEIEESEKLDEEPVDVPALIVRIRDEAAAQDEGTRSLEAEIDEQLWLTGSQNELYSAFSNLVLNAMRYTEHDGRIRIRWLGREDGGAVFEVKDNGVGIDEKHLPFITQRFYRIDSSRSRAYGGSGLGLAIVKHVLERHQGELQVESVLGEGSTFRCLLPAQRVCAPRTPAVAGS